MVKFFRRPRKYIVSIKETYGCLTTSQWRILVSLHTYRILGEEGVVIKIYVYPKGRNFPWNSFREKVFDRVREYSPKEIKGCWPFRSVRLEVSFSVRMTAQELFEGYEGALSVVREIMNIGRHLAEDCGLNTRFQY